MLDNAPREADEQCPRSVWCADSSLSHALKICGTQFLLIPYALKPKRRTPMRLHRNQLCPIHRSLSCCGREAIPKVKSPRQLGIRRVEDAQHPRGYRELRSNAEMRKLLDRKITTQNSKCALCGAEFTDYGDIVPDHISPRGMGGAWRDDHPDNIQAVHWWCNGEKGSTRI